MQTDKSMVTFSLLSHLYCVLPLLKDGVRRHMAVSPVKFYSTPIYLSGDATNANKCFTSEVILSTIDTSSAPDQKTAKKMRAM